MMIAFCGHNEVPDLDNVRDRLSNVLDQFTPAHSFFAEEACCLTG